MGKWCSGSIYGSELYGDSSILSFPTNCARVAQSGLVRRPYKTEIEGPNPSMSTNNKYNEGV